MITAVVIHLMIGLAILACLANTALDAHDRRRASFADRCSTWFGIAAASVGIVILWPALLVICFTAAWLE